MQKKKKKKIVFLYMWSYSNADKEYIIYCLEEYLPYKLCKKCVYYLLPKPVSFTFSEYHIFNSYCNKKN